MARRSAVHTIHIKEKERRERFKTIAMEGLSITDLDIDRVKLRGIPSTQLLSKARELLLDRDHYHMRNIGLLLLAAEEGIKFSQVLPVFRDALVVAEVQFEERLTNSVDFKREAREFDAFRIMQAKFTREFYPEHTKNPENEPE